MKKSHIKIGESIGYTLNDAGRAQQFADTHHENLRYVPAFDRWLIWSGNHWQKDDNGGITRKAIEHSQRMIAEAAMLGDHTARSVAVREALGLGNAGRIESMLALAKCDRRLAVSHASLDANPLLLGVGNGVIDLRTATFREGCREDLITKRAGTTYERGAKCPRWLAFLAEVFAGDGELIGYMQRLVGYTLTGDTSAQLFPFLFGGGKNGKTVFIETLYALLGDYAQRAPASLLTLSSNGREPTNEIARLHGARLVVGSETEEGARLAESRVKDLTGGDTLTGRYLYAEAFDFKPRLKLWLFGNHKPEVRGTDDGIWRRVRLIPFTVQIAEERRDAHLAEKLAKELPGILAWAMEGTRLWRANGLETPRAVAASSSEYREEEDTLADFVSDEIEEAPGQRALSADVFTRYQRWAARTGLRFPLSQRALNKQLSARGMRMKRTNGQRRWEGIALK